MLSKRCSAEELAKAFDIDSVDLATGSNQSTITAEAADQLGKQLLDHLKQEAVVAGSRPNSAKSNGVKVTEPIPILVRADEGKEVEGNDGQVRTLQ